jgi:hypothetical protein
MQHRILGAVLVSCGVVSSAGGVVVDNDFILARGDADNNGTVNMADATFVVNYLLHGGPTPPCLNQADANNDGAVSQSDSVYLLNWLYGGGSPPPAPGPFNTTCAQDDSPFPGCAVTCR